MFKQLFVVFAFLGLSVSANAGKVDKTEEVYSFNAVWLKKDKYEKRYLKALQASVPVVKEYGGEPVAAYRPVRNLSGDKFSPTMFGVIRWPSEEKLNKFLLDPRTIKAAVKRNHWIKDSVLLKTRELSQLPQHMGEIGKSSKVYVFNAVWLKEGSNLKAYTRDLKKVMRLAARYGAKNIGAYETDESVEGDFTPQYLGVLEWPSTGSLARFAAKSKRSHVIRNAKKPESAVFVQAKQIEIPVKF